MRPVRSTSGPSLTEYTYTGQYSYTQDFGLMFYNARWYDPALGRFAQADSIVPPGVHPHSLGAGGLDRYAYVNNSPMNYVDPSGHFTCSNDKNSDDYCPNHLESVSGSGHNNHNRGREIDEDFTGSNGIGVSNNNIGFDDIYNTLDIITPTHAGWRAQIEGSYAIFSFSLGYNAIYNRNDGNLATFIDFAYEFGFTAGAGASATTGPLIGLGSSHIEDVASGTSYIFSGTIAGAPAASAAISAPIESGGLGLHVDEKYNVTPATVYLGGGAGAEYIGVGGGGNTVIEPTSQVIHTIPLPLEALWGPMLWSYK